MKAVTQEDLMGCGIACVACVLNKSYKSAKKLFRNPKHADTKGYYCRDIIDVLKNAGLIYTFVKATSKNKGFLKRYSTIVFIARNNKYFNGHYLVKTEKGWMNPWINFPNLASVRAGFQKKLPSSAQWIIYQTS